MAIKLKLKLKDLSEDSLVGLIKSITLLDPNQTYEVFVVDKKPFRTLRQNAYLWGVVYDKISQHTGYEPSEIHEICKVKFGLRTKFSLSEQEIVEYTKSTKYMSTAEMTNFIDQIRSWSNEKLNLYIPQPNEISAEDYIKAYGH